MHGRFAFTATSLMTIAVVLFAGLLKFADPLGGDQSLFLIGAHAMHDGAILYTDFWDLKQPGIYAFYYLATSFGSYSPIAVHLFELAYMLLFAIIMTIALRASRSFGRVAEIAPIATVAFYFLAASSFEQIQVESLVAFPLFASLALTVEAGASTDARRRFVLHVGAGIAVATVLAFKLLFLPIAALMVAIAIIFNVHRPSTTRAIASTIFALGLGIGIPTLATLAFFASHHALDAALNTWFVLPPQIVANVPHESISVLWGGLRWFVHRFIGMALLAAIGLIATLRRRPDAYALGTLAWLVTGAAVILLQVTSWFQYQWLLLDVPLGLFATLGARTLLDALCSTVASLPVRATAAAVLLAGLAIPATLLATDGKRLAAHGFALSPANRERYRDSESIVYAGCRRDALALAPNATSVYVIGNPTFYIVAHHLQPIALNGSSVRLLLPWQWSELQRELDRARPKAIYISHGVRVDSPKFATFLALSYAVTNRGTLGDIYASR